MLETQTYTRPAVTTFIVFSIVFIIVFIMISWTGFFLLCSVLTPVLCCDWLRHYGQLSNTSLHLVQIMGGELTDQESPVSFPSRIYNRAQKAEFETQLVFIKDSLELIAGLYRHDNLSSVTWDTVKTEKFLMMIHRQTDGLSSCVTTPKQANRGLRKYYRRLKETTLYHTGGSVASWELIRKESKRHLERLDFLVNLLCEASRWCCTPSRHCPH